MLRQCASLTLAAAMLAALLLTIALANAQEPPEPQTATRLEPGINLVGWVGEPTSTSQLFDEIPQLESIWAWDAELDDWIVAGRDAPEGLGWLWRVSPGMGLRLVLGGEESFLWQRSTEPTRGLVKLRTGWNLVAWSGADDAPLEQVAKGIGWSLRELRRWDAATQQWTTWTSPERSTQLIATSATDQGATDEEAEPVTVRRAEALWVNVARAVNWLQPTDILPRLIFPGGASDALQARVREDLEAVLAFYGQQYGIQAEPDFTVYVAKDVEALIQAQKDDGDEIDVAGAASIRARWDRVGGWAGENVVVKQNSWPEDLSNSDISWARYVLTHEYFHILQSQLSDGLASQWLVEGTATWAEDDHQAIDGSSVWEDAREDRVSAVTESTPSLRSTESDNAAWEYTLGWLAVDRLTEAAGGGSHIEFWRRLAPTEIGPHSRWTSTPDWRTAFQETFGVSVSSFYADFDAWQRQQAMVHGSVASASDGDTRWIRGRVTDESGAPVAGMLVNAIQVEGETSVGWNQRAETDGDGAFAVRAPEEGDYRLSIDIADDCTRYYSNGRLTEKPDEAQPVAVAGSDLQGVSIQLLANICGWQIRGQVVNATGEPLAGVSVYACPTEGGTCTWGDSTTQHDGSFAVSSLTDGEYDLRPNLTDGCTVYYRTGSLTTRRTEASRINVTEAESPNLQLRVPEGMCAYQITGTIVDADGMPLDTLVIACEQGDRGCASSASGWTDNDGSFAITVPADGRYQVSFSFEGCAIYFRADGFTTSRSERFTARVAGRDARLSPRQIPEGMCARRIAGRFVDANGAPLVDKWIYANGSAGSGSVQTDANGGFEIRVSSDDAYHFAIELRRQPYCRRNPEGQALGSSDNPVRVSGADVTGITLRLPGTIEELCG